MGAFIVCKIYLNKLDLKKKIFIPFGKWNEMEMEIWKQSLLIHGLSVLVV